MILSFYEVDQLFDSSFENFILRNCQHLMKENIDKNQFFNLIKKQSPGMFHQIHFWTIFYNKQGLVQFNLFTEQFCDLMVKEMYKLKKEHPFVKLDRDGIYLLEIGGFKKFFQDFSLFFSRLANLYDPFIHSLQIQEAYVIKYDTHSHTSHELHVGKFIFSFQFFFFKKNRWLWLNFQPLFGRKICWRGFNELSKPKIFFPSRKFCIK